MLQILGNSFERKLAILKGNSRDSTPNGHKSSSNLPSGRRRSSSPLPRSAGSDYRQSGNRLSSSPTPVSKKLFEGSPANNRTGNNNPFYQLTIQNLGPFGLIYSSLSSDISTCQIVWKSLEKYIKYLSFNLCYFSLPIFSCRTNNNATVWSSINRTQLLKWDWKFHREEQKY